MITTITHEGLCTTAVVYPEPGSITDGLDIRGIFGEGHACCRPSDLYVAATGDLIALGRAIQDFGRKVEVFGLDESVGQDEVARVVVALGLAGQELVIEVEIEELAQQEQHDPTSCPTCVEIAETERQVFIDRWVREMEASAR